MAMAIDRAAIAAQPEDQGDHGQGERNRYNGPLAHNLAPQYCGLTSAAMRRASSFVIRLAAARRPRSSSK